MVFHLPECRNHALRARLDERIDDVRHAFFAYRPNACVARRKRHEVGVQGQSANLAYLEQAVVCGRRTRRENEG